MAVILLIIATAITCLMVGAIVMAVLASAAMSHSQERMQRKVRYWQARAKQAENANWR